MPNHVYNKLTGPKKVLEKYLTDGKFDFRKILPIPKHAKEPELPWEIYDELRNLNDTQKSKIINELKTTGFLSTQKKTTELTGKTLKETIDFLKYNTMTQYDWKVNNWGTKWNAYNQSIEVDGTIWVEQHISSEEVIMINTKKQTETTGTEMTINFSTAWSPPYDIIHLVSKKEKCVLQYEWIEEQGAACLGKETIESGIVIDCYKPDPWSKEAYELMFEWWGNGDEFIWNDETGEYEYIQEDE